MKVTSAETEALTPLWSLTLGASVGAASSLLDWTSGPNGLSATAVVLGAVLLLAAAGPYRAKSVPMWFLAGLLLAAGHGSHQSTDRKQLETLIDRDSPVWIRARLAVSEGWSRGKWGWRARVAVLEAHHPAQLIPPLRRARLEIRGDLDSLDLPEPGTVVEALVSIRGSARSPLLVASSGRLLTGTDDRRWLSIARDRLSRKLLDAAGLDVGRLRAAELASVLSLGRRDLMPTPRREGWRRSGLAHVLAVSGLHVGLVAGMAWLILAAIGTSPVTARWVILVLLPTYAVMAGASPSAIRAAMMGCIYVGARLVGRAILPMAAVLLTASVLLIADPSLIGQASFQLTIILTAALVRWAPVLVAKVPLPRWLAGAIAIPCIAQLAAAPLVATHFASAIPGAAAANLLVPWLLGPVVLASVAAAATAPLSSNLAGWCLGLVHLGERGLWLASSPGRWCELVLPPIPVAILCLLGLTGLIALLPCRKARHGVTAYLMILIAAASWWWLVPPAPRTQAELLPVSDGLALRIGSPNGQLLVDGGSLRREAAELLAEARIHHLDTVIATHADDDHTGGLETVLRTIDVDALIIPHWMRETEAAVPLIRAARRRKVPVLPVARGSRVRCGAGAVEILWPAADDHSREDNERALVARVILPETSILVTSDIGRTTESLLVLNTNLRSDVLVVPHHGSRHSSSPAFLDAVNPAVALIPAGPKNLHRHPHQEVVRRLQERGADIRMPIRDGRCGARWEHGAWVVFPEVVTSEE